MKDIGNVNTYTAPAVDMDAIFRYSQCFNRTEQVENLARECLQQINLTYKVCFREFDIKQTDDGLDLTFAVTTSKALQKNLDGCKKIILFAATVGIDIDRLILRNSRLNPTKALIFQAIGTERVESLCDMFEADLKLKHGYTLTPRFSPGYADLPLEMQSEVFRVLDCYKNIGVTLNDSLLMSPSKSVTAIIGVRSN